MSVSEFRSRLQFTFPYRNVFQSVLSQFPFSYYNLRPLLGVLYRFAQYEIFLILQFTFQQQIVLKAKTMLNNEAITIHVPTQERYNRCCFECNRSYFKVYFNSRSRIGSAIIAKLLIYYFRYYNSHSHVWSAPQILVLAYTFYNSRSRIGSALTGSGPGPTQMRFQFTLPRRERPYKVPNIWLIINFNSRSRIGSVDIHDTFHVQV